MIDFNNLDFFEMHGHDEGSNLRLLDCINKTEDYIEAGYKKGLKGVAVTNHASLSTHVKAVKKYKDMKEKAEKNNETFNYKIALGDEIYLLDERVKGKGTKYFHFILIAKDRKGYDALKELSSMSWENSYWDRGLERVVTLKSELEEVMSKYKGHLIATSSCLGGELPVNVLDYLNTGSLISKSKIAEFVEWNKTVFGSENFFIELQPSINSDQIKFNQMAVKIAKAHNVKFTIANDVHYINKEDREIHGSYLNSKKGERELSDFYESTYMKNSKEIYDRMAGTLDDEIILEGINNTVHALNMIEIYDLKQDTVVPSIELPVKINHVFSKWYDKYPAIKYFATSEHKQDLQLFTQIEVGYLSTGYSIEDEDRIERLNTELHQYIGISEALLQRLSGYYTLVDFIVDIMWDDNKGDSIVPAGRGSVGSWLIARLLDISQVDPIEYDLPYWRHVHESKKELSDIDLDSEKLKRQKIFDSIKNELGHDRCLNIATFKTEGSRSALLTSCRGLDIPIEEAQEMADMIPFERGQNWSISECLHGNDEKERKPIKELVGKMKSHDKLVETALKIEGLINGRSIHASGFYVFADHYLKFNSLMKAPNGKFITAFNMSDSDYMGGLKIDILTIEAADKIRKTMELLIKDGEMEWQGSLRATYNKYLHPDVLNYTDEEMWSHLAKNDVMDLFQFNTDIGQQAIALTKPKSVLEMASANALMRLEANDGVNPIERYAMFKEDISLWYKEMREQRLTDSEIKILEKYLLSTYGVCGEQEDLMIMSMAEELSQFTFPQANKFKSGVAKKKKKEIANAEVLFYEQGRKNKCSDNLLNYVWNFCFKPQFGYAFSKPHDVAYSLIAIQELNLYHFYGRVYWNTACLSVASGMNGNADDDEDDDSNNKNSVTNYGKIAKAIAIMKKRGVNVELPEINTADEEFKPLVETEEIMFGLKGITNIGDEISRLIMHNKPYLSIYDFIDKINPTNIQMINLIKAGSFDKLHSELTREQLIKKYLIYKFNKDNEPKTSLNYQNFPKILSMRFLPQKWSYQAGLYKFKSYFMNNKFKCEGNPKRYQLDEIACEYFEENLKDKLTEGTTYYKVDEAYEIIHSKFEKFYTEQMKEVSDWLNLKDTVDSYNIACAEEYVLEIENKYCIGSLAKWEMDSLSFYYTSNEFDVVDLEKYNIVGFNDLPVEPEFEEYFSYKLKKTFKRYQINKIAGTVLDVNKTKYIVYLLTTDNEVVSVKFYDGAFIFYNKGIKDKDEETNKTVYSESSWFKRGNKLTLAGFRSGSYFFPRKYQNTIYQHTVALIEEISEDGELKLKFERGEEEDAEI